VWENFISWTASVYCDFSVRLNCPQTDKEVRVTSALWMDKKLFPQGHSGRMVPSDMHKSRSNNWSVNPWDCGPVLLQREDLHPNRDIWYIHASAYTCTSTTSIKYKLLHFYLLAHPSTFPLLPQSAVVCWLMNSMVAGRQRT